jgi:indole-3-glycerol phosphate synthase
MSDFLLDVAQEQRERAAALRSRRRELERRAARRRASRSLTSDLRAASRGGAVAVIAEVKRRSPAAGELATIADPGALALEYAAGGAAAISVLTEERHFRGSLEDLARVRDCVRLAVLRKDFIVDELQLLEARAYGADAVLLIAELLDDDRLLGLLRAARELGLEALVEAHEPEALDRAIRSGADAIGINQRDLRTLELDRGTAARLASRVPADRVLVAESGVAVPADVRALPPRVDAVLVGTALVGAAAAHRLVRDLGAARRAEVFP